MREYRIGQPGSSGDPLNPFGHSIMMQYVSISKVIGGVVVLGLKIHPVGFTRKFDAESTVMPHHGRDPVVLDEVPDRLDAHCAEF